jgi:DNA (cytosine-5)-methyltransferase 1
VLNLYLRAIQIPELQRMHGIDLSAYRIPNKRQVLRNMVSPKTGLHVRDAAIASMPIDWRIAL